MRTISPDLKARFFAIIIGLTYIAAVLLAMGITRQPEAAELSPQPELGRLIEEHFAEELVAIDAQFNCRLGRSASCDEFAVLSGNQAVLLADRERSDHARNEGNETVVPQSNPGIQVFE